MLECYKELVFMFKEMGELYYILEEMCMCCGVIFFEDCEVKVLVDENGYFKDIFLCMCGVGEWLIEFFMLVVNEIVVCYYYDLKLLFIYWIYE